MRPRALIGQIAIVVVGGIWRSIALPGKKTGRDVDLDRSPDIPKSS